ncbi:MAG TPA: SGNH/GDSL hydrolase family protein [Steroidobacter sp.]|uniref:SGNH/GDSL hydrolase family protein n=1 Tax=Steroidobacter sp. TaxID=1978227 RepID=UPI002ED9F14C
MEKLIKLSRRYLVAAAAGILIATASAAPTHAQTSELGGARWVATWSAPLMANGTSYGDASRSFDNQTVRQIVPISVGGTKVRVRLSNEYGEAPLIIGSASVAVPASGSAIVPNSYRPLRFRGQTSVVIPRGAVALSDPIQMQVPTNSQLAISVYVAQDTGMAAYHPNGNQTVYISSPGDFSDAADFPTQAITRSRYWLTFVEVLSPHWVGALALFGDSISEGSTTTQDANLRVSDVLSRTINSPPGGARLAILNQSTGCARLLFDFCGPSGISRFEREVLNATGITHVLIELGYVDIIYPTVFGAPAETVSADQIIAGLRQLIRRAKLRGLRVYGATLLPNGGSIFENVFTPENEAKRQAVNRWIRTTREFDAVADYDLALRDPSEPTRMLAAYDTGDGLHPNDAGHAELARTIVLSLR